MSTTGLEKESLEAHVDLCAERYGQMKKDLEMLAHGINNTNTRLDNLENLIITIDNRLSEKENNALRSIIRIAGILIFGLLGSLATVVWYFFTNSIIQ
jgi:hypothetical protein